METIAFALVGPLLFIGAVAGIVLMFVVPAVFPGFRRPFWAAWAVSSSFVGTAMIFDQAWRDDGSLIGGFVWAIGTSAGLGALVPLIWYRVHMWDDLVSEAERRKANRYRPVDFEE